MGKLIAIFGPHGVGKTSLQKEALLDGTFSISEGFEFPNKIDDCANWDHFWKYQMGYWDAVKENINKLRKEEKDCILSRSFEEQVYYLKSHPLSIGHEEVIEDFYNKNIEYKSDLLVYLDADFETLNKRIAGDKNRFIDETRWWYRDRYYLYDKINKSHDGIHIIDTSHLSPTEVLDFIKRLVKEL